MTDTTGTPEDPQQTVTNDAVAGETVISSSSYAGADGGEAAEAEPTLPENSLGAENVDLRDEEDDAEALEGGHAS
jgi:hypothetical protein